MIHAVCRAFNNINKENYINEAWEYTQNNEEKDIWQYSTIHLRSAHVIHLISSKTKFTKVKNLKKYIMYTFARLQNTKTDAGTIFEKNVLFVPI